MRKRADDNGVDVLLVDTGDRVEGNGLYDASNPQGNYTYDIYREQEVDIICSGNHELYQAGTADREHQRTVPNFKNTYIASNLDYIDGKTGDRIPLAQRYRKFQTKNQKLDVVAFGFLFDFNGNANNTVVQPVEETIQEDWFQQAIREKADVFVVIGHVGIRMDEFKNIFTAIRKQNWFTPIVLLGGHAHVRDATSYDSKSFALASGRYFETIGWLSVDGITKKADEIGTSAVSFQRRYIDNNLLGLYYHSGLNETTFPTEHGRNVSRAITEARKALDLDKTYGCAPQDYWMSRAPFDRNDSIYVWLQNEVLPDITVNKSRNNMPRLAILNTGTIRFDIFKGAFTKDSTYIVSPFLSKLKYIPEVPYNVARKVIQILNSGGQILEAGGRDPRFMAIPEQWSIKESFIAPPPSSQRGMQMRDGNQKVLGGDKDEEPALVSGYTTRDDFGNDGDDAVHESISFYAVPNCIQAEVGFPKEGEPERVDLVFLDFIQPWIILALKFSGGDYSDKDVDLFLEGTFTQHMEKWIKENWKVHC